MKIAKIGFFRFFSDTMTDYTDPRIIKTHRAIRNALIDVLQHKPFKDIAVQDILDAALVNRSTFYKYYSGKSSLAAAMIAEIREQYSQGVAERFATEHLGPFLNETMPQLYQHRREVLALWQVETKRLHLYHDMQEILQNAFVHYAETRRPEQSPEARRYQAAMYAALAMANTRYWLEQEQQPEVDDTFGLLQELFEWLNVK